MQLFHWRTAEGNFGDDMNVWFWDDVMPGWREGGQGVTLIGIGSLLTTSLALPSGRKLVAGTGAGYGGVPVLTADWDVRFVRGPRTAMALGLDPGAGLTDPAALASRLPRFTERMTRGRHPLFIPHWQSDVHPDYDWSAIASAAGVEYLSPRGNAVGVIRAIAGAPLVLAESLHAAIIADAFRVPWLPVRTGIGNTKPFKWEDWCASLELPMPRIIDLFAPITRLRRLTGQRRGSSRPRTDPASDAAGPPAGLRPDRDAPALRVMVRDKIRLQVAANSLRRAARATPHLSRDNVLADRLDRVSAAIRGIARDYGATTRI